MGRRTSAIALAGLILVAGAPGGSATAARARAVSSAKVWMSAPGLQPLARLARSAGLTDQLAIALDHHSSGDPKTEEYAVTYPVADLNGDRLPDEVVTTYQTRLSKGASKSTVTATAIAGRTGRPLWERSYHDAGDKIVLPVSARVGRDARRGVWLIEVDGFGFETSGLTYRVRALAGDGAQRWSRKFESTITGTWPITFVATDYLVTLDEFDALPGRATDLLVATGDVAYTPETPAGEITAAVVDGRDGKLTSQLIPEVGAGFVPFAVATDDLDGRAGDDYVFVNERPSAEPGGVGEGEEPATVHSGVVVGRAGVSGTPLWTATGLDLALQNVSATNPGDVTGDRRGDIFVDTVTQVASDTNPEDQYATYLVDGGAGALAWSAPGAWPYSPGDVDGDRKPDFLTQAGYAGDGFVATHVWMISNDGGHGWDKEFRTEDPTQTCCQLSFEFGSWGVGDLDGDHLEDGYLWHIAGLSGVSKEEWILVGARSGKELARAGDLMPLGQSVDRGTADVGYVRWTAPNDLVFEVRNGATRKVRISTRLRLPAPIDPTKVDAFAYSDDFTGDHCADVLLDVYGPVSTYEVLVSGANGQVVWSKALAGGRDGPAEIEHADHNRAC